MTQRTAYPTTPTTPEASPVQGEAASVRFRRWAQGQWAAMTTGKKATPAGSPSPAPTPMTDRVVRDLTSVLQDTALKGRRPRDDDDREPIELDGDEAPSPTDGDEAPSPTEQSWSEHFAEFFRYVEMRLSCWTDKERLYKKFDAWYSYLRDLMPDELRDQLFPETGRKWPEAEPSPTIPKFDCPRQDITNQDIQGLWYRPGSMLSRDEERTVTALKEVVNRWCSDNPTRRLILAAWQTPQIRQLVERRAQALFQPFTPIEIKGLRPRVIGVLGDRLSRLAQASRENSQYGPLVCAGRDELLFLEDLFRNALPVHGNIGWERVDAFVDSLTPKMAAELVHGLLMEYTGSPEKIDILFKSILEFLASDGGQGDWHLVAGKSLYGLLTECAGSPDKIDRFFKPILERLASGSTAHFTQLPPKDRAAIGRLVRGFVHRGLGAQKVGFLVVDPLVAWVVQSVTDITNVLFREEAGALRLNLGLFASALENRAGGNTRRPSERELQRLERRCAEKWQGASFGITNRLGLDRLLLDLRRFCKAHPEAVRDLVYAVLQTTLAPVTSQQQVAVGPLGVPPAPPSMVPDDDGAAPADEEAFPPDSDDVQQRAEEAGEYLRYLQMRLSCWSEKVVVEKGHRAYDYARKLVPDLPEWKLEVSPLPPQPRPARRRVKLPRPAPRAAQLSADIRTHLYGSDATLYRDEQRAVAALGMWIDRSLGEVEEGLRPTLGNSVHQLFDLFRHSPLWARVSGRVDALMGTFKGTVFEQLRTDVVTKVANRFEGLARAIHKCKKRGRFASAMELHRYLESEECPNYLCEVLRTNKDEQEYLRGLFHAVLVKLRASHADPLDPALDLFLAEQAATQFRRILDQLCSPEMVDTYFVEGLRAVVEPIESNGKSEKREEVTLSDENHQAIKKLIEAIVAGPMRSHFGANIFHALNPTALEATTNTAIQNVLTQDKSGRIRLNLGSAADSLSGLVVKPRDEAIKKELRRLLDDLRLMLFDPDRRGESRESKLIQIERAASGLECEGVKVRFRAAVRGIAADLTRNRAAECIEKAWDLLEPEVQREEQLKELEAEFQRLMGLYKQQLNQKWMDNLPSGAQKFLTNHFNLKDVLPELREWCKRYPDAILRNLILTIVEESLRPLLESDS